MPLKLRELIKDLLDAGFVERGGKGSHRKYRHPSGPIVVISGKPGGDAKRYQIHDVRRALDLVKHAKK